MASSSWVFAIAAPHVVTRTRDAWVDQIRGSVREPRTIPIDTLIYIESFLTRYRLCMNVGMNATFQSRLVRRVPRNSTEQGLKAGKVG